MHGSDAFDAQLVAELSRDAQLADSRCSQISEPGSDQKRPSAADAQTQWRGRGDSKHTDGCGAGSNLLTKLPEGLCGDLDSLSDEARRYFEKGGVPVLWCQDQDLTDLEKAWRLLLAPKRYSQNDVVVILGAIGGRLDHTLSAIHFLHKLHAEHEAAKAGSAREKGEREAVPNPSPTAGSGVSTACEGRFPRVGPLPQASVYRLLLPLASHSYPFHSASKH
ncbi:hypothetical protein NCLIV_052210 [Neospora caninum Liverpool]|uniref:Thiamin pyrophosphokinase catalytic domain-containing protein n=1 Tax=Neospora caninum (strain Liverpool) TaxID=572307 RepID=F0VL43_NEOCL|nr:hypothetical protein NCLIV_052210 [Neospora caninum Liverpool]CBZ54795.1 hypothetical protein NCLIV_052210 [Neospora caninum Liverpool]|eukprot:XP_003884823.1 hypothetical protein NCLIV_052210 [Neospora caninum Liverpool]